MRETVSPFRRREANRVLLLPEEPAGTVCTSAAGVVDLAATLLWRGPERVPAGGVLLEALSLPGGETFRYSLSESGDPGRAVRRISGTVLALTGRDLALALDAVLRAVGELGARSEAVLEVSAVRRNPPVVAPPPTLEGLARDLEEAGFFAGFKPSWTPAAEADVALLGTGGASGELTEFLRRHPLWRPVASGA